MNLRTNGLRARVLVGVALAALAPHQVLAQDAAAPADAETDSGGLEEIVVTAQHREERLRDVPIAVNAIGADALQNVGIASTAALVQAVPSLNFSRSGPSGIFVIRGVATPNGTTGEEGSTAVYVDDVYMPDLAQTVNTFNNIQRIEVLNGPQGTLFGRNAVGGLIRIITRDPGDRPELNAVAGYGNYDTFSGQVYASTPLSDNVGVNVAFTGQDQGKGFGFNPTLNRRVKTNDYWGLRSKLVAQATETLKFTLSGDYFHTNDTSTLFVVPIPSAVDATPTQDSLSGYPSGSRIRAWGVSGKGELDLGSVSLTSITAYRKLNNRSRFDVDGAAADVLRLSYESGSRAFQQELRLASNSTDPLSWQIGAFYLNTIAQNDQQQILLGTNVTDIDAKVKTNSISFFGEATYNISSTTHLTGGLRWTSDNRKLVRGTMTGRPANPEPEVTFRELTYRIALRQDLSEDLNVYASVNRGFKAGLYNLSTPTDRPVRPQTIMAYEVGLKGDLLDRRLRMNLAAYHYDIEDYQIRASPGGVATLTNAAKVKIDGVDANFEAVVTDQLRLTAGASYLDAKYDSFPTATTGDATGNRTALAPKFTFNLGGTYTIPFDNGSELRLTGNWTHKSKYYFEPNNLLFQPKYDVFNGSIEFKATENYAVELYMRNIGNERYNVQEATAVGAYALAGLPRQYGVNFKVNY